MGEALRRVSLGVGPGQVKGLKRGSLEVTSKPRAELAAAVLMAPGVTRRRRNRYNTIDERDLRDALTKTTTYFEDLPEARVVVPLHKVRPRETKPYRTEAPQEGSSKGTVVGSSADPRGIVVAA